MFITSSLRCGQTGFVSEPLLLYCFIDTEKQQLLTTCIRHYLLTSSHNKTLSTTISPTLFQTHPSENIYWTNYNALQLDILPALHIIWQSSQYCARTAHNCQLCHKLPCMGKQLQWQHKRDGGLIVHPTSKTKVCLIVLLYCSTERTSHHFNGAVLTGCQKTTPSE